MLTRRLENYVPFALRATGVVLFCLAGCRKAEEPEVPVSAPESYMNDKAFRSQLADARKERTSLAAVRARLVEEMQRKIDAVRAAKPGADDAAVKAELEKDLEWVSLEKRVCDLNAAIEENRLRATKAVGERINPKGRSGKDSGRAAPIADAIAPLAKEISK